MAEIWKDIPNYEGIYQVSTQCGFSRKQIAATCAGRKKVQIIFCGNIK